MIYADIHELSLVESVMDRELNFVTQVSIFPPFFLMEHSVVANVCAVKSGFTTCADETWNKRGDGVSS